MSDAATEIAQLAPSDLLGLCLGVIGALLVLFGAYHASVLISKDPREIERACAFACRTFGRAVDRVDGW
jgi:hypothetical protein